MFSSPTEDYQFTSCVGFLKHFVHQVNNNLLGKKTKTEFLSLKQQNQQITLQQKQQQDKLTQENEIKKGMQLLETRTRREKLRETKEKDYQLDDYKHIQVVSGLRPRRGDTLKEGVTQFSELLETRTLGNVMALTSTKSSENDNNKSNNNNQLIQQKQQPLDPYFAIQSQIKQLQLEKQLHEQIQLQAEQKLQQLQQQLQEPQKPLQSKQQQQHPLNNSNNLPCTTSPTRPPKIMMRHISLKVFWCLIAVMSSLTFIVTHFSSCPKEDFSQQIDDLFHF